MAVEVRRYCFQAFIIQSLTCVIIDAAPVLPWAFPQARPAPAPLSIPYSTGYSLNAGNLQASYGGGFSVTSVSPITPTGLTFRSETNIDGDLKISGKAPFLAAIVLEGEIPTRGSGTVTYNCGNGDVAILSENFTNERFGGLDVYYYGKGYPVDNGVYRFR